MAQRQKKTPIDKLEQSQGLGGLGSKISFDGDGGVTVDLSPEPESDETLSGDIEFSSNLVSKIKEDVLALLGLEVKQNVDQDKDTRYDWESMIEQGTQLLGLKLEEKNSPFKGACSAHHPLLMESAVKFQSKASNELLPANGPVKTKILGEVTPEREEQANRVAAHMNYQITEQMTEFYTDSERMLLHVPLFGSGFKKTYYSAALKRPVSEFVPADQLIVPNNAPDLHRAERYTHVLYKTKYQMEDDFDSGLYIKPESFGIPTEFKLSPMQLAQNQITGTELTMTDANKGYTLYEQHICTCIEGLDTDEDSDYDIAKPYIVTIDSENNDVLGVRRNWKEEDKQRKKLVPFTHYQFVPGFGFYGFGFLHLLGNLQLSLTSSLRSLVDAGQFSNLQGGFKLKGVRIINDGEPIHPGQFKEIETGIMDINKSIMRLPFGEPSNVLFQMLEFLDGKGAHFADATDQVIADSTNYGPVGTTLALLDASTKFFSAIHKRLHNSLKHELKTIAEINSETLEDDITYNIEAATMTISKADYSDTVDIIPVSDPNISSNAHRMAKAQTMLQVAQQAPQLHDMREVLKHFYASMDYGNVDKILPQPPPPVQPQPADPVSDIIACQKGMPIQAFPGQQHQAHIQVKQAFLGDPNAGGNDLMKSVSPKIVANIQEHMVLMFQEQIQAQMQLQQQQVQQQLQTQGGQVPQQPDPMQAMAQAAQQVALMNQQQLQQQLANQQQSIKDQATMLVAQAEVMDTHNKAKQIEYNHQTKTADIMLKSKALDIKAKQEHDKVNMHVDTINHDLHKTMVQGGIDTINTAAEHKNKLDIAETQAEAQKENQSNVGQNKNT